MVPCWKASEKLEYAARTIRGKITKLLPEFFTEFPPVDTHPQPSTKTAKAGPGAFYLILTFLIRNTILKLALNNRNKVI